MVCIIMTKSLTNFVDFINKTNRGLAKQMLRCDSYPSCCMYKIKFYC